MFHYEAYSKKNEEKQKESQREDNNVIQIVVRDMIFQIQDAHVCRLKS